SAPLFLSSASSAALQRLLGQQCASAGTAAVKSRDDAGQLAALDGRVRPAMTGARLAPPALSVLATNLYTVGSGTEVVQQPTSRLVYRDGAIANVARLPGAVGGRGVWLPEYLGDRLGAKP